MLPREAALGERHFGSTTRRDAWWVSPALVFLGLGAFIIYYATWAAFQGTHYHPEGITITDNAIIPLKDRVVDDANDPLVRLWRLFRKG